MKKLFKIFLSLFIVVFPWQVRWIFHDYTLGGSVWEYGRLSLYGSIIILLLAGLFFILSHKQEISFSKNKFLYFIFLYSIIVGLLSGAPIVYFYYLAIIYLAVLFAYLLRFLPKYFIFKIFLVSGLIQAVLAIYQFLTQRILPNKWLGLAAKLPSTLGTSVVEFADQRILRAHGALPHPNMLGGFFFLVIFLGIYLWIDFYKQEKKKVCQLVFVLFSLALSTYGLLTTLSRSAFLALALGLLSVLLINIFRKNWLVVGVVVKYLIAVILVFYSFTFWAPGAWSSRWQASGRLEKQSVEYRIDTLDQLNFKNYKNILVGQGLGLNTWGTYQANSEVEVYNVQPIHNIFILALAEVGILGIALLIMILVLIFKSATRVDVLSTSLLLGLIVIGMFDHYLWTSWLGWLLLAFGLVNLYRSRK